MMDSFWMDMNTTQIFYSQDEFARGNDIWHWKFDVSFAKRRLAKFNGCTSEAFVLPLEQDEFTNHRNDEKL